MNKFHLSSVLWKEEAGYVAKCPELGVASAGDTLEEALKNLKEAIELFLENAKILGLMPELKMCLEVEEKFTSLVEVTVK